MDAARGPSFAADQDEGPQQGSGRPIPPLVSKIQVATTNAGARAEGGLTPDFLALSSSAADATSSCSAFASGRQGRILPSGLRLQPPCRRKSKAKKNPRRFGGQSPPISSIDTLKKAGRKRVGFSAEVQCYALAAQNRFDRNQVES